MKEHATSPQISTVSMGHSQAIPLVNGLKMLLVMGGAWRHQTVSCMLVALLFQGEERWLMAVYGPQDKFNIPSRSIYASLLLYFPEQWATLNFGFSANGLILPAFRQIIHKVNHKVPISGNVTTIISLKEKWKLLNFSSELPQLKREAHKSNQEGGSFPI